MKYSLFLSILLLPILLSAQTQTQTPMAVGGEHIFEHTVCVTEESRARIVQHLQRNTDSLKQAGVIPAAGGRTSSSFIWPVRQVSSTPYNSYYGISNYVDHNPSSGNLQDYDCGQRTYDLNSGYDHRGTDIFLWPFYWHQVNENRTEVIAAADGIIIFKEDGNNDTNCDFSDPNWNAIYLRHTDGTVTWYGHMKNGSVTSKSIGQTVISGEYLGIVASSGSSTGPHLHFEVWEDDTYTQLLDPYKGDCNDLNDTSLWAEQEPYRKPTINHVMTNSATPVFNACPQPTTINEKTVFLQGETVHFSAYFRDHLFNDRTELRIIQPNGTTWSDWTHFNNGDYNASWWSWFWDFPGDEPLGTWTFEVRFMGQVQTTEFIITNSLPVEFSRFWGEQAEKTVVLDWETLSEAGNSHFTVQRSRNGIDFISIGRVEGNGDQSSLSNYRYVDSSPQSGNNFYRLEQVDFSGTQSHSAIINIPFSGGQNNGLWVYPNPLDANLLTIENAGQIVAANVSLLNAAGQQVTGTIPLSEGTNRLPLSLQAGVYFLRFTGDNGDSIQRIIVR